MQPVPCDAPGAEHDKIPVYTCICEMRKLEKKQREVFIAAFLMGFSQGKDVPLTGFPTGGALNEQANQAYQEFLTKRVARAPHKPSAP